MFVQLRSVQREVRRRRRQLRAFVLVGDVVVVTMGSGRSRALVMAAVLGASGASDGTL